MLVKFAPFVLQRQVCTSNAAADDQRVQYVSERFVQPAAEKPSSMKVPLPALPVPLTSARDCVPLSPEKFVIVPLQPVVESVPLPVLGGTPPLGNGVASKAHDAITPPAAGGGASLTVIVAAPPITVYPAPEDSVSTTFSAGSAVASATGTRLIARLLTPAGKLTVPLIVSGEKETPTPESE